MGLQNISVKTFKSFLENRISFVLFFSKFIFDSKTNDGNKRYNNKKEKRKIIFHDSASYGNENPFKSQFKSNGREKIAGNLSESLYYCLSDTNLCSASRPVDRY